MRGHSPHNSIPQSISSFQKLSTAFEWPTLVKSFSSYMSAKKTVDGIVVAQEDRVNHWLVFSKKKANCHMTKALTQLIIIVCIALDFIGAHAKQNEAYRVRFVMQI